jgi:hypothetical protein
MSVKPHGDNDRALARARTRGRTQWPEAPVRRGATNEYFALVVIFVTSDPHYVNIPDIKFRLDFPGTSEALEHDQRSESRMRAGRGRICSPRVRQRIESVHDLVSGPASLAEASDRRAA